MILVVGSINMDIVFGVQSIPRPGETVLAGSTRKSPGGKGANQAVAAAKLGGDVIMLGCIGKDENGVVLKESMQCAGVNTDYLLETGEADTSCAYICVSDAGENCIVVDSSANMRVTPAYLDANEKLFAQAEYCILQMEIPAESVKHAIKLCKQYGVKVILNPSPLSSFEESLLEGADYVIPNEVEAAGLLHVNGLEEVTPEKWFALMQRYRIRHVVMTAGKLGAYHYEASGTVEEYPTKAQKAVDTTGAGDTFLGAFAASLSAGKPHGDAIRFANRASGIAVTRSGAQNAMPTLEEVKL